MRGQSAAMSQRSGRESSCVVALVDAGTSIASHFTTRPRATRLQQLARVEAALGTVHHVAHAPCNAVFACAGLRRVLRFMRAGVHRRAPAARSIEVGTKTRARIVLARARWTSRGATA